MWSERAGEGRVGVGTGPVAGRRFPYPVGRPEVSYPVGRPAARPDAPGANGCTRPVRGGRLCRGGA
ncbi:hypothetical protein Sliba_03280 [Streptomyces nigrescens]|uniref:Uncharacterized protein n=1 Tax=Streptomyces nigrescens TaxID=1920 RepID=A0A640TE01_STRNI|nr:hypothetical protein Sliba_03280 [Streptomyces libani subsp. libani]GGV85137.1 hypothetical protein GCM10010500_00820 [Streptomyces libani subsp. libani]